MGGEKRDKVGQQFTIVNFPQCAAENHLSHFRNSWRQNLNILLMWAAEAWLMSVVIKRNNKEEEGEKEQWWKRKKRGRRKERRREERKGRRNNLLNLDPSVGERHHIKSPVYSQYPPNRWRGKTEVITKLMKISPNIHLWIGGQENLLNYKLSKMTL